MACRQIPNRERLSIWGEPLPEGYRLGWTCAVIYCGNRDHMTLVADLTYETRKRSEKYSHIWPHLETLEPGKSILVAIPLGNKPEEYATGLRNRLHTRNDFRWLVRIYGDKLKVKKHGVWGGVFSGVNGEIFKTPKPKKVRVCMCLGCGEEFTPKRKKYECCSPVCAIKWVSLNKTLDTIFDSPLYRMCNCGCGKVVWPNSKGELRDHKVGHRAKKWMQCRQCGKLVPAMQRQNCCSRKCRDLYRGVIQGIRNLDQKPWEQRPDKWKRIRCVVCRKYVWRHKWQTHGGKVRVCYSINCKQKLAAQKIRKMPADRDVLHELAVVKKLSTREIAEMFAVSHCTVRRGLRDVGLEATDTKQKSKTAPENSVETRDQIRHLYIEKKMSASAIAKHYSCSTNWIYWLLKRDGVFKNDRWKDRVGCEPSVNV